MAPVCTSIWKTKCHRESVKQKFCRYTCNKEGCDRTKASSSNISMCTENSSLTSATIEKFQTGSMTFALDMYHSYRLAHPSSNVVFSPSSISLLLAMVLAGAENETYAELNREFIQDISESELFESFRWLLRELNKPDREYALNAANAMYLQDKLLIEPVFQGRISKCLESDVNLVEFESQPTLVRKSINKWVADQTAQKIKNLLPDESVNAFTSLILVNAAYFKAEWFIPFNIWGSTHKAKFYTLDNAPKMATMMSRRGGFLFSEHKGVKVLGLPYKNNELIMYILLPNEKQGLPELESTLTTEMLTNILESTVGDEVKVTIPKFKMQHDFPLQSLLKNMGVKQLFTDRANLSGITRNDTLFVSGVFHKAFIEVNERGTEAAAATGMIISSLSASLSAVKRFYADHPFIFFIRHEATKTILFMGVLLDVTED